MGWMKLNAKFSQQVSQGLGFKLEIPWRKTCVFNIPCTSIHNYPHAIEKLETWKCGWYISRNHPGNTYKIIKYSVWYILHIFCIHETLIQLIPSYPVLSHLLQGSMRARSEEMRDGLACYQGKSEGFTIINGMLTKKACLPGEIRYVGTRFI